jgi:hypothetical protein
MTVVNQEEEQSVQSDQPEDSGFSLVDGHVGVVDMPESAAPHRWSSTWSRARAEAAQRQAEEERFSWMKEADLPMLSMGLEPVPWERFPDAISQTGETIFQAIEQRTCQEQVFGSSEEPGPDSLVGATLALQSPTVITALRMVSHDWKAPGATAKMLSLMAESLPEGAQMDLIVSTPIVQWRD